MSSKVRMKLEDIDALIKKKQPFAIFRIPGEETLRFLTQTEGDIRLLPSIELLNGQKGFVIAPFRVGEGCPLVLMEPDVWKELPLPPVIAESRQEGDTAKLVIGECPAEKYVECFTAFLQALRAGEFDKLVLSRAHTLEKEESFSPVAGFCAACRRYMYSYVYLCYTPFTGMWLGSTPEVILSGSQGEWHTVALAGTQSLQDGALPQQWDAKNREEQEYVASYIREQLLSLDIHPIEKGPYPAFAGALAHLKTDFRFSLPDNGSLGDLLHLLHPTPAVCGLPKEKAYRFIKEKEGYDRSYYSGFVGWLDPEKKTDLYVNLRCMNIGEQQLTLYAGGGLLASSQLGDEWQETEKKLQTMLALISNS